MRIYARRLRTILAITHYRRFQVRTYGLFFVTDNEDTCVSYSIANLYHLVFATNTANIVQLKFSNKATKLFSFRQLHNIILDMKCKRDILDDRVIISNICDCEKEDYKAKNCERTSNLKIGIWMLRVVELKVGHH